MKQKEGSINLIKVKTVKDSRKKKTEDRLRGLWDIKWTNICIRGVPEV